MSGHPSHTPPLQTLIRNVRVHDPVQGLDGEPRDLAIRDGRFVTPLPGEPAPPEA